MSNAQRQQSTLFRGIYEFEDPSGGLIAAKVPSVGSVDLYDGTVIVVKPNQCAIFIYKGLIADVFLAGTHTVNTENFPVLSKLANWKFGFQNPLRCELVFIAGQAFTTRRWGTAQPVLVPFEGYGTVPIRAFGNFNVVVSNPEKFYMKLMGTRSTFAVSDIEEFIQGQIVELLPKVLANIKTLESLSKSYDKISKELKLEIASGLKAYGLEVDRVQVLSALPSKEVLEAMEAKTAINIIGSQKEYLLYKAANSLGQAGSSSGSDPLQTMVGLMLGKGLLGADYHDKERPVALQTNSYCAQCGKGLVGEAKFCSSCGKKV